MMAVVGDVATQERIPMRQACTEDISKAEEAIPQTELKRTHAHFDGGLSLLLFILPNNLSEMKNPVAAKLGNSNADCI